MSLQELQSYFAEQAGNDEHVAAYANWLDRSVVPFVEESRKYGSEDDKQAAATFSKDVMLKVLDLCKDNTELCEFYRGSFYHLCKHNADFYKNDIEQLEEIADASFDMARMIPVAGMMPTFAEIEAIPDGDFARLAAEVGLGSKCGSTASKMAKSDAFSRQNALTEIIWALEEDPKSHALFPQDDLYDEDGQSLPPAETGFNRFRRFLGL